MARRNPYEPDQEAPLPKDPVADALEKEAFLGKERARIIARNNSLGIALPEKITQDELRVYAQVVANLELIKKTESEIKQRLIVALECGVPVEEGLLGAVIDITRTVRPKWKEICILTQGQEYVNEVAESTKPTFGISLDVGVRPTIKSPLDPEFVPEN